MSNNIRQTIIDAIQNKEIVVVKYDRIEGGISERRMEPFDISPGERTPTDPDKFWGWCLFHNTIEGKYIDRILSVTRTGEQFNPELREQSWGRTNYRIPRNW